MITSMQRANAWSQLVIGAAIEVLIVELKAVEKVLPIHKAQLLSYMKLLNQPLGLLINFHELVLRNGIYRMILKGGDSL
jgi:GxxExxY protein